VVADHIEKGKKQTAGTQDDEDDEEDTKNGERRHSISGLKESSRDASDG
jgi:hypothetical protein